MNNQLKYLSSNSVISPFNPILTLEDSIRKNVNASFIQKIVVAFFEEKEMGFEFLDADKLKTEIDFRTDKNFVNAYLYEHVVEQISKDKEGYAGQITFIPKCVITFDEDLTPHSAEVAYPYSAIFGENYLSSFKNSFQAPKIHYGKLSLGKTALLYFIRIELQPLIKFIKTFETTIAVPPSSLMQPNQSTLDKVIEAELQQITREKSRLPLDNETRQLELERREQALQKRKNTKIPLLGKVGALNIRLMWNTTDDLDLHVKDPDKNEIDYSNKKAICQGHLGILDVDANASAPGQVNSQENIYWDTAPEGEFEISVNLYSDRNDLEKVNFEVFVMYGGDAALGGGKVFSLYCSLKEVDKKLVQVTTFNVDNINGLMFY